MKYRLTDKIGCLFNDRVEIVVDPSLLERLYQLFKNKAEQCNEYRKQKEYHELCDFFKKEFDLYKEARGGYDKKDD